MRIPTLALIVLSTALADARTPEAPVDLLEDFQPENFVTQFMEGKTLADTEASIFQMDENGMLRISGAAFGYLRTKETWSNYHLVVEYGWGEHTWGHREDRARDAGVFVHCQDPDQGFHRAWPFGIEAQLIEGGSGNLNVLGSKEEGVQITAPMEEIGEERFRYHLDKAPQTLSGEKATLYASYRDPDWKDQRGFLGPEDKEELFGNWNRLEVICTDNFLTVKLNGEVVNAASDLPWDSGYIALQTEYAEWFVNRWEVYPLDEFKEIWEPEEKSTNTGSGANLLPRGKPLSPEDSLAAIEVDGPWEVQLVAAEPLVNDPVDVVWDRSGNMYVAEMRDYPLPPLHGPLLSRIRILQDTDADGYPDKATDWAEPLDHVQGLLSLGGPEDGVLVTTRTQVLHLTDTDGDLVADRREVWFESNEPRHSQLQISCPRWGPDGWIYLNNGLDGKEIYPTGNEDAKVEFSRKNLRIHPQTREIQVVSGFGQFGAAIDDYGRRFASTNRNPVIFAVMPRQAVTRNPFAALATGHEDIAPFGGDATVYPVAISHTTANAHLGTHTAACGTGVYRGSLMPELLGNVFVCEPTGQLITRARLEPDFASFRAERVRNQSQTEFIRSRDEWFRPVNLRNGPDGALYICDIYRRFIDHSRFFPDEFQDTHYMRAGFDQGRIYRIVPKGYTASAYSDPLQPYASEALNSGDNWTRDQAQKALLHPETQLTVTDFEALNRLVTKGDSSGGRVQALWTLQALGKLSDDVLMESMNDPDPGVVENAAQIASTRAKASPPLKTSLIKLTQHKNDRVRLFAILAMGDFQSAEATEALKAAAILDGIRSPWLTAALLSGAETRAGDLFQAVTVRDDFPKDALPGAENFIEQFTAAIAARGDLEEIAAVFSWVADEASGEPGRIAAISGMATGFRRHQGDLDVKTLAALLRNPPEALQATAPLVDDFLLQSMTILLSTEEPVERRLQRLPLIRHILVDDAMNSVRILLEPEQPPAIRTAAMEVAASIHRIRARDLLFEVWDTLDPQSRDVAIPILAKAGGVELLKKMKAGEINPALLDPMSRWSMQRSSNEEMQTLARELFGQPSEDRAAVLEDYQISLTTTGDVGKGQEIFTINCSMCHKVDGQGMDVGPDITDVRNKPIEALLSDILDPNRMTESRWIGHTVKTADGRVHTGLVESDTGDTLTLIGAAGIRVTLNREEITSQEDSGLSLMPVGLEAAINPEQMADLLAFLRNR